MKKSQNQFSKLQNFLVGIRDAKDMQTFLEDLLTPQELASITERWQIIQLLLQGKTHRQIAKKLDVSIGKVTRGSRIVQFGKMNWKNWISIML